MDRGSHLVFAGVAQLAAAHLTGLPLVESAASVVIAAAVSWGPDVDQLGVWHAVDRPVPDEALGHGGPMKHRGITHWWLWPVLAAGAARVADLGDVSWVVWALILGWASHLVGDFLFGVHPHGIPVAPWWAHVGVGWDSGGRFERFLFVPGLAVGAVWWLVGHPGSAAVIGWASAR